eukprot:6053409-Alexandrium_andersonii.AAC.1
MTGPTSRRPESTGSATGEVAGPVQGAGDADGLVLPACLHAVFSGRSEDRSSGRTGRSGHRWRSRPAWSS